MKALVADETVIPTQPLRGRPLPTRERRLFSVYDRIAADPQLEHLRYMTRFVPGRGSVRPSLLILADVPTPEDSAAGKALVGRQRTVLEHLLRAADLKPEYVFFTYLLKYRPPNGRDPRESEAEVSLVHLHSELNVLRPKIILLMGKYVTSRFYDEDFKDVRGELAYDDEGVAYLPMYSLEAHLHNPAMRGTLLEDAKTLAEAL